MPSWYRALPFHFDPMEDGRYLCTSMAGDHLIAPRDVVTSIANGTLARLHPLADRLCAGMFLATDQGGAEIDLVAARLRTRWQARSTLASLHIVVTTLRCPNSCRYCQVTHTGPAVGGKDLSPADADGIVRLIHSCPSPAVKIEFQGGDSLLTLPLVERIVLGSEALRATSGKATAYVLTTSLAGLTEQHLDTCQRLGLSISTSIDGPADLHDANRPSHAGGDWHSVVDAIHRCRERLGPQAVSALMTTTRASLGRARDIVDTYVDLGFPSIFLRWLNPFGDAVRHRTDLAYSAQEWLAFWRDGLARVIEHNRAGRPLREEFACILLRRMLASRPCGFVDLDSPTGAGTLGLVYHYDGGVYVSDEARMLAEMGDQRFRLGSVADSFPALMANARFREDVASTMLEATPRCARCACQPWCGVDPVHTYATTGDIRGRMAGGDHCQRMEGAFHHLARLLEGPDRDLLLAWGCG